MFKLVKDNTEYYVRAELADIFRCNEHKPNKFVRLEGSECVLGYISTIDNSTSDYVRLYNDKHNIFQMEILNGSDRAYSFVANCTELFDILRDNFIGTTMSDIVSRLADNNYITL